MPISKDTLDLPTFQRRNHMKKSTIIALMLMLVFTIGTILVVERHSFAGEEKKSAQIQKWQYKCDYFKSLKDLGKKSKKLGLKGWEMVNFSENTGGGGEKACFKRPKKQASWETQ